MYFSASHFRGYTDKEYKRLIGRANRLLHWDSMIYFKNEGLSTYSLGAWSDDKTNKEQQNINSFKESFGSIIAPQYLYYIPHTILGHVYIALGRFLSKNRMSKNLYSKIKELYKKIKKNKTGNILSDKFAIS
jgi:hypothetical protein